MELTAEELVKFWELIEKKDKRECWIWKSKDRYFKVHNKWTTARRIMYVLTHGGIPEGAYIITTCRNQRCISPFHLKLSDNKIKLHSRRQQLSVHDIRRLKFDWSTKTFTQRDLAIKYGISQGMVSNIVRGKAWKLIDPVKDTSSHGTTS